LAWVDVVTRHMTIDISIIEISRKADKATVDRP
jgi:hypothetical protein